MIISYSKRFVFARPQKVAGSSVEVSLWNHCGPGDVMTPLGGFGEVPDIEPQNDDGWGAHYSLRAIRHRLNDEALWQDMLKVSIVRNPWDQMVSWFWFWQSHPKFAQDFPIDKDNETSAIHQFRRFVRSPLARQLSTDGQVFLDRDNTMLADVVIRYETLQKDFYDLCNRLHIAKTELPRLRSSLRRRRIPFSAYFDKPSAKLVGDRAARIVDLYGYTLE